MKKVCIVILGVILVFFIGIFYYKDDKMTSSVVMYNGNNLMISIDGDTANTLPTSGNYYLVSYDCKSPHTVLTWNRTNYTLDVSNGNKKSGVSCYLDFQSQPKLADMPVGSYVSYTGNNGCIGESCNGQNANYVSDDDMGYCYDSSRKFIANGWRIGYIENNNVYLVSAGATDCACTSKNGVVKSTGDCSSDYETTVGLTLNVKTFNEIGLKYCNKQFVDDGKCSEENSYPMDAELFSNITGSEKSYCYSYWLTNGVTADCGYNNDLIDNGGYYWFTTIVEPAGVNIYRWFPLGRGYGYTKPYYPYGVRPVVILDLNVTVTGGNGTYDDPYIIGNNAFWINDGAESVSVADSANVSLSLMTFNAEKMCVSTDTSVCTNYVNFSDSYTLDWSGEDVGEKTVYVYYKDVKGKIVATLNRSIILTE